IGRIDFDDLNWERRAYSPWPAYGQSKLANIMFALELSRRLGLAGSAVRVTAAHPGYTATDLQRTAGVVRLFNPILAMKPADGAMPTLRAATDPAAASGSYYGPAHFFEMNGPPVIARISKRAQDEGARARLFDVSEVLTGVTFPRAAPASLKATG
ncbi:MAG TPA: short-chain dehydrogenase, partial [Polyangiaceae bacterium]|nr:short-chain dehydrogenase [Polyangiaceae bacterium]